MVVSVSRLPFGAVCRRAVAALTSAVLALNIASGAALAAPAKPGEFQTELTHALLIDAESGSILFEHDADSTFFPASLAKLMTAEVVFNEIRQGHIKLEDEFLVSENAWRRGGAPSRTTSMFAPINSRASVENLLRGVIVQSANDACIALAEGISKTEGEFALLMTKRARELGLTKSEFTNSTGLPSDTKTTARELAKLAQHMIRTYPEFYKIYAETEFTWNKIHQYNRNPLLKMGVGADGLQAGSSKDDGYGLVGSATQNGMRLIVVAAGAKSDKERDNETKKLLDWGFRTFDFKTLFAEGQTVGEAKVFGGADAKVPLVGDQMIRLMVPRGVNETIIARIVYSGPVPAPVKEGTPIGVLKVWRNGNLTLEAPLHAAADVGVGTLSQRAFDAVAETVIVLFFAGVQRL
jgi:D-alanyl-D-alanine carboxypeptidase (penicillin-binding protein 5/6)